MRSLAGLFFGAAVLATAAPLHAELRQFGNVIYPTIPGWSEPRYDDGHVRIWSDLPDDRCEFCRILIGRGGTKAGPLEAWLTRNAMTFIEEDEREDYRIGSPAQMTGFGNREAAMMGVTDGRDSVLLVAIDAGTHYALTGFYGDAGDDEEIAESMEVMTDTYLPWLTLLRFRSDGAPALLPEPVPGDMEGLWWGFRLDTTLGLDMMMRMENSYRRVTFWPDGTFFEGTPPQGTAQPDRAALREAFNTDWGNYTRDGDRILLNFVDGRSDTLTREGKAWKGEGYDMFRATPLSDGTRLDGSISTMFYSGFTPGSGTTGGVASSSETVFHPDGRFTGSRFGGSFGNFDAGGGFAIGNEDGDGGRYEIRDGLLIFSTERGDPRSAEAVFRAGDSVMVGDNFFEGRVIE